MNDCKLPPAGLACTREEGHEGPCAAVHSASAVSDEDDEDLLTGFADWYNRTFLGKSVDGARLEYCELAWQHALEADRKRRAVQHVSGEPAAWMHPASIERLKAYRDGDADGFAHAYAFASPGNDVDIALYAGPPAAQAVPNDDTGHEWATRHHLFIYEVDFGEEGKGRYIRLSDFNKVCEKLEHAANEWADAATNGLQYLKNVRDGLSSFDSAIEGLTRNIENARSEQPRAAQAVPEGTFFEPLESQIDRLAKFIIDEVPGEPAQSQGAIDTAIRWMRESMFNKTLPWAVEQWHKQVKGRPLNNVHRRTLDNVWRQVIRHEGGDDIALCGPAHDDILAEGKKAASNGEVE